jgi:hypothetical protein
VCYGYRYGEVALAAIGSIKESAWIGKRRSVDLSMRPPVAVSLGCHVNGSACPHPDPHDPRTMEAGVRKRFTIRPPKYQRSILRELRAFTRKWIRKNLVPLSPDSDCSVETWLNNTHYSLKRRQELLKKWSMVHSIWDESEKYFHCKSFQKDETYPEYKHARAINSRSDEFKCAVGPIFKLIEAQLYQHPSFIKHIPVADRPAYIAGMLERVGAVYMATDYTAYESHFIAELMKNCEFELYDYMTSGLPQGPEFMKLCRLVLAGRNTCKFKNFVVEVDATRMSGEMCTSLGNGFANLMFMLFMCDRVGCTEVNGVVEGDDGLFAMIGSPPTSKDFESIGLTIKIDLHDSLNTASFCGIIFDPEDKVNVTDPREVLATFGWATAKYLDAKDSVLKMMLRCKALSLAHQYPGCPLISSLAQYALRMTRSYDVRGFAQNNAHMSMWEKEQVLAAIRDEKKIVVKPVPTATRQLVSHLYGISSDQQIHIERYFDSKNDLSPINDHVVEMIMKDVWRHYSSRYVGLSQGRYPSQCWPEMAGFKTEWVSAAVC